MCFETQQMAELAYDFNVHYTLGTFCTLYGRTVEAAVKVLV